MFGKRKDELSCISYPCSEEKGHAVNVCGQQAINEITVEYWFPISCQDYLLDQHFKQLSF